MNARSRATLRLFSHTLSLGELSEIIGAKSLYGHSAGDMNRRRGKPFEESLWTLESTSDSEFLEDHVEELIRYVEARRERFEKLQESNDYEPDLFCYLETRGGQAGFVATVDMMSRLTALRITLVLDIHGGDE